MFLDKYIEKVGTSTEFPIFNNKISTNVVITTNDLFLSQYKDDYFNAVDIVVKYLAIENYYGLNNYGFKCSYPSFSDLKQLKHFLQQENIPSSCLPDS